MLLNRLSRIVLAGTGLLLTAGTASAHHQHRTGLRSVRTKSPPLKFGY
jgi:hypothetical protein